MEARSEPWTVEREGASVGGCGRGPAE